MTVNELMRQTEGLGPLEKVARTHFGDIANVNANLIEWRELEDQPGNYMKVLTLDEKNHRVDFLFKQDPHQEFTRHNHNCTAVALTLDGVWGYREGDELMFPGCFSYEPAGTIHTPYATDKGMVVYASFAGASEVFLDLLDDDDQLVGQVTMDFFRQYYQAA